MRYPRHVTVSSGGAMYLSELDKRTIKRNEKNKRKFDVCLNCTLDPNKYCGNKECPKVRRA